MKPELIELLKVFAYVLENHSGGLSYDTLGGGVNVSVDQDWRDDVCIGFPDNGDASRLREIIEANAESIHGEKGATKP